MDDIFHFARHTFTTKKVREGYSFEEVGKMIGDTGQIVELTYSHLTRPHKHTSQGTRKDRTEGE
jgi:hypothetical protein